MRLDNPAHPRRSQRLAGYDYSSAGVYFVTIVAHERRMVFGDIREGEVRLSGEGEIARSCWLAIPEHFEGCSLGEFVVMPNHLHGLLELAGNRATHASPLPRGDASHQESAQRHTAQGANDPDDPTSQSAGGDVVGATHASPSPTTHTRPRGPRRHSLGAIVGSFKSATARLVNRSLGTSGHPLWQRNFFEHVVRDADSLLRIAEYIVSNPLRWDLDPENPASSRSKDLP